MNFLFKLKYQISKKLSSQNILLFLYSILINNANNANKLKYLTIIRNRTYLKIKLIFKLQTLYKVCIILSKSRLLLCMYIFTLYRVWYERIYETYFSIHT